MLTFHEKRQPKHKLCNWDADIENRLLDKGRGGEGEGEINGESSMDAYTLTYVKGC